MRIHSTSQPPCLRHLQTWGNVQLSFTLKGLQTHRLLVPWAHLSRSIPDDETQAQSSALLSSSLAMDSEYEIGHVRKLQAQHTHMQEKTFTKWINNIFRLGRVSKI